MVLHSNLTRRALLGGLLAATSHARAAERDGPPSFDTAQRQFRFLRPARKLPPVRLVGLDGHATDMAALLGDVTLVNFWASWCAACRNELPVLERLHVTMSDQGVRVAAISIDRGGRDTVAPYLRALNVRRLPVYLDPEGLVVHSDRENRRNAPFALYGMPISYLIDRTARVVGYMPGDADWMSPTARSLLAYYAA